LFDETLRRERDAEDEVRAAVRASPSPSLSEIELPDTSRSQPRGQERFTSMLYTIAVILLVLWLVGWLGFNLLGGLIHILVVLAVILFLVQLFKKAA